MDSTLYLARSKDWDTLVRFLPFNWEEKAKELGAVRRCRKFGQASSLLRILLIHLSDGCSLRETVVRAKKGGIVSISDVALFKRLKASREWLRWMAAQTMVTWMDKQPPAVLNTELNIRVIDGTSVQEPGSTGSTWRIHYSICLPSLRCDEVEVTSPKVGESFKRFTAHPGDLFIGDRGFCRSAGIAHVVDNGGNVLVRISLSSLPVLDVDGKRFPLLEHLRTLPSGQTGDWDVRVPYLGRLITGRICAVKKSGQAADKARHKAAADSKKNRHVVRPQTIESAGYIFVFTTLDRSFDPTTVLEMYRGRWQIELVFKRLKSLIGLGHLKKTDLQAATAWLHGKLLVAFLIEALIRAGENFFPWGYPLCPANSTATMSLERNISNASPI